MFYNWHKHAMLGIPYGAITCVFICIMIRVNGDHPVKKKMVRTTCCGPSLCFRFGPSANVGFTYWRCSPLARALATVIEFLLGTQALEFSKQQTVHPLSPKRRTPCTTIFSRNYFELSTKTRVYNSNKKDERRGTSPIKKSMNTFVDVEFWEHSHSVDAAIN